jgi:hypothetical protein
VIARIRRWIGYQRLLVARLFPLIILGIGAPIALVMWGLTEIAHRL